MSLDVDCFEKIGLLFSARSVPKTFSTDRQDPFLAVFQKDNKTGRERLLGHTAVLNDNPNPDWVDQLVIDYMFEQVQEMIVRIYDYKDGKSVEDFASHHLVGEVKFPLSKLMCARGQTFTAPLEAHPSCSLIVRGEAVACTRDILCATFKATKLLNKDGFFATSDPFLQISRKMKDGQYVVVWRNEKIDNNLSPTWPAARIPMMTLCNANIDCPLRINIFDFDHTGNHKPMGCMDTTVRALMESHGAQMNVIEADKRAKSSSYVNSGTLCVSSIAIEKHPTFSDYIMGGCEVSFMVAIDFTGSNGAPTEATSLHYLHPTQTNEYERAIEQVGRVIEPYDTDKKFPVYGFGAKVKDPAGPRGFSATVQHAFPVYGGGYEVTGIDGILQAYKDCVHNVALSGPTFFAPLLQAASGIAAAANVSQANQKYFVLLILTDGVINDMDETINALIAASTLPLSVIIVGVGHEDFSDMNALDADGKSLRSGSSVASRDIVQFVPFREMMKKGAGALSETTLAEVPSQVLQYMSNKRITPNPRMA